MTIKILNPIEVPNWNDQVAELPGATIFHTANWARVLVDSYNYKPRYFCTVADGSLTNIVPMMGINSLLTGKRGVSLPFSDQVEPLVTDKGEFDHLVNAMLAFGKKSSWKTIAFNGGQEVFTDALPSDTHLTFRVKLCRDNSQLFDSFKGSTRRNIRKAIKTGVVANIYKTKESINEFYWLNCITRKDHGLPPQPFTFFEMIYEHIIKKGKGFVCLGKINGKSVSGAVFFHFNGHAIFKYGASLKKFLAYRPNNLVIWESIKASFASGAKNIDLGRTETHHEGLIHFKRGWGCSNDPLNYFTIDITPGIFVQSKKRFKSSYAVFSQLPIPVLKILGKWMYRHVC